ncbi:MAG: hypothetical protein AAGI51_11425 [Pseudomonadota bacterium]
MTADEEFFWAMVLFPPMVASFLYAYYWQARVIVTVLPYIHPDRSLGWFLNPFKLPSCGRGLVGIAEFWNAPEHERLRRRWLRSLGIVAAVWIPGFIVMFLVFPFEGIGK